MMTALVLALAMFADPPVEYVAKPSLPGFVIGYQAQARGASIIEEVPEGESVQDWTRMVTTQRFDGLTLRISGERFLGMLAAGTNSSCAGATSSEVQKIGGAFQVRVDCPLNPSTGKPETFFAKALPGSLDLHVVQVAFRRVPTGDDVKWAETYLGGIALCAGTTVGTGCKAN